MDLELESHEQNDFLRPGRGWLQLSTRVGDMAGGDPSSPHCDL